MQFSRLIIGFMLGATLGCANISIAQITDTSFYDINYIKNNNPWLQTHNPSGLQYVDVDKVSVANVAYEKADGAFKNYYQSDNSYKINIGSESFYRLNRNVIFYGAVDYQNFRGKNMQGSAWVDPYTSPLNFDDNTDSTAGTKKLEGYTLSGSVSAAVSQRLTLGGAISYEVADYAKLKDLRHINRLLNMDVAAGVNYTLSKAVKLGLSYNYVRRIESLKFEVHGNTDKQYLVFLNYDNFYGRTELFGEDGLTDERRPIVNNTHGMALQADIRFSNTVSLLNEFSYTRRSGYYGKKATASIVFTEHDADSYEYTGVLKIQKNKNLHLIQLKAGYEDLINMENVYSKGNTSGGSTIIIYHGQNEVLNRQITKGAINYKGYLGVANDNPLWVLNASFQYMNRYHKTSLYPFLRIQDLNLYEADANASRNFIKGKDMYTVSLGVGYGGGSGTLHSDGTYQPVSSARPPASRDSYLNQEYEFLTASRIRITPAVQYAQRVSTKTIAYLRGATSLTSALNTQYLGKYYNIFHITLGCLF